VNDVGVFTMKFGRTLEADVLNEQLDSRLAFVMATSGAGQLTVDGVAVPVSTHSGAFVTSTQQKLFQYPQGSEIVALMLDQRKITAYCAKLLGRELEHDIAFQTISSLQSGQGQSWQNMMQHARYELSHDRSLVRTFPAVRHSFEQMLITGLLFSQTHSLSPALLQPQSAAAPFYVKRAEDFIVERFAEPLSLADIAAHAQVSARSLQSGFQNFRGMTPMAFLRSVRLQHAHLALLRADPAIFIVTQIALSCGFSHLGEFAAMYRRAFGETPRQTMLGART
jgi:AraC-like DNA-binding protein